jgi:RHS repeat-associated protein
VYFDDLEILHTSSNATLQADDFYPFGLPMDNNGFLEAGVEANRFLYQGKEWQTDLGLNLYDFHARQFDPALGRWLAQDPKSQFSSPYNGMGNMPTVSVDPDGQLAWFVPIIIGAALNVGSQAIAGNIDNFWDGLGFAAVGGLAGYLGGISPAGILPGAGFGAASGATIGTLNAAISGDNIGQSALWGGITGGVLGGVSGGIKAVKESRNLLTGKFKPLELKASDLDLTAVADEALPATDEYLNEFTEKNFGTDYKAKFGVREMTAQHVPFSYQYDEVTGNFINPKGEQILGVTARLKGGVSDVYISKRAFSDAGRLFQTTGHELIHSYHHHIGLSGLNITAGTYQQCTENAAYSWNFRVAKTNGWQNQVNFFEGILKNRHPYSNIRFN